MVAMMAKTNSVPVVVCCETYKFSEGVMVDGFSKNELGATSRAVDQLDSLMRDCSSTFINIQ